MDSGLDSLQMVKIASEIGAALAMRLPGTLLFDYPTAGALIRRLEALLEAQDAMTPNFDAHDAAASGIGNKLLSLGPELSLLDHRQANQVCPRPERFAYSCCAQLRSVFGCILYTCALQCHLHIFMLSCNLLLLYQLF